MFLDGGDEIKPLYIHNKQPDLHPYPSIVRKFKYADTRV